jgi:two-component system nitrogen regulation response regulator GlnG
VGENLRDHLQARLMVEVKGLKTLNTILPNPLAKLAMGARWLMLKNGLMSVPGATAHAYVTTLPGLRQPLRGLGNGRLRHLRHPVLPPLRERREDIPVLTRHFLQQSAQQLGVEAKRISDSAIALLQDFAFPGNVRQLENICHWLTVMAPAQAIEPKDLPPEVLSPSASYAAVSAVALGSLNGASHEASAAVPVGPPTALNGHGQSGMPKPLVLNMPGEDWQSGLEAQAMALLANGRTDVWDELTKRFEATLIQTALAHTRGRRIDAANKLGIGRNTITRKIQELGLE